jgi:CRP-like cAMP-binding protein
LDYQLDKRAFLPDNLHVLIISERNYIVMPIESLIGHLSTITNLSPAFIATLKPLMEVEIYKSHQVIHAAGQVENRFWYLDTGFARTYYFDQSGKEHTLKFFSEKEMLFSFQGFWKESTDYYIEILGPSELISLTYVHLSTLIQNFPETQILNQVFTRHYHHQELFKSRLMTWSAEERYYQFRKTKPDIFKKASIRLIASYLNMTRENLSRLMGRET